MKKTLSSFISQNLCSINIDVSIQGQMFLVLYKISFTILLSIAFVCTVRLSEDNVSRNVVELRLKMADEN